jgi:hypothetical protein
LGSIPHTNLRRIRITDPFGAALRNRPVGSHHQRVPVGYLKGAAMAAERNEGQGITRLSFIKSSAGVAAGLAAVGVPVVAAQAGEKTGVEKEPSGPVPAEPVTAFVRDARRGEVTVLSGSGQKTYHDKALVQRLLAAAPKN